MHFYPKTIPLTPLYEEEVDGPRPADQDECDDDVLVGGGDVQLGRGEGHHVGVHH